MELFSDYIIITWRVVVKHELLVKYFEFTYAYLQGNFQKH